MSKRFFAALSCVVALSFSTVPHALAEDMDLALSRLSTGTCEDTLGDSSSFALRRDGQQTLSEDNAAWRQVVTQLAPAIAPAVLAPVTTTGPRGFDVAFETNVTRLDENADYWARGSRGHGSVDTCDGRNRFISPVLASNRLHFDKGLPFGVTLGATVGRLYDTSLWIVGADMKIALVEGLRTWAVPDIGVRAAANTVVGDSQYSITTLAADVILSKNIVAGQVMQIAPYVGGGALFTFASSQLVDLTPNIDDVKCAAGTDPICNDRGLGASQDDVGHNRPFKDLSLMRYRGFAGLSLRYGLFALTGEFVFDLTAPHDADKAAGKNTPRQWTINIAPSLTF